MKRWTLRILICLLLGAVTTVGITWAIASWIGFDNIEQSKTEIVLTAVGKARVVGAATYRDRSGWPMYAMMFHGVVSADAGTLDTIQWGWRSRSGQRLEMVRDPSGHRLVYAVDCALPLRPIWPGFLIDTLFYGTIGFGFFLAFGAARRTLRKKRGLCPMCAYDLRGGLPQAGRLCHRIQGCPECGWNRERDQAPGGAGG